MKKVTILVPCYNEEKSLPLFYTEVRKLIDTEGGYNWEILFVNDGSKDNTFPILKAFRAADPQVSYLNLSRNFGKERAMLAGFDYAQGDCVIIMDADLQDPPSLIPQMLRYWETGYKDVYAKRNDRGRESWLRKQFSLLFYKILSHTTRFDILQNVGDFRLLDRQCVESLKKIRETERYTKGLYCWIGYEKKEIVFDRSDRIAGSSNWNFWSLFDLAIEGITSFTTIPLRIATITGVIVAIFAFVFMIFYIGKTLLYGDPVQGFTTLVSIMLFMSGVILLAIGILGEYVGRIFNETKNRPTYIASDYNEKVLM